MKEKTEVMFEVGETIALRQGAATICAVDIRCGHRGQNAVIAAALFNLDEHDNFRLLENGPLHFLKPIEFLFVGIL